MPLADDRLDGPRRVAFRAMIDQENGKSSMVAQRDGGRAALGGFLYQIVAIIGLRALFESREDREGKLSALLSINGRIRIEHEKYDTDAVVEALESSGSEVSLVQFKYSRQVPPPPIAQSEYGKIVRSLSDAATRAKALGKTIASYHLITTRARSPFDAPRFSRKQDREVASQLVVVPEFGFDGWLDALMRFGRTFGSDNQEIEDGIYELVGRVFDSTNSGTPCIERRHLVKAAAGHADAKPIRRDDLEARMTEDLRKASEGLWSSGKPLLRK